MTQELVNFGRQLFSSADLDPIYLALLKLRLDRDQLARWLVAYWAFYNAGFACYASEQSGENFWKLLAIAAENRSPTHFGERWPRGAERRHFRGHAAIKAVEALRRRYGDRPEDMLVFLVDGPMHVGAVIQRARMHVSFGSWIGFKVADMIDAVWQSGCVGQDDLSLFLYAAPRRSIEQCYSLGTLSLPNPNIDRFEFAMRWLANQLGECRVPHKPESAPDWFSLETVFCKHLSHTHGHYPLLKDTKEITHGIKPWMTCSATARKFALCLPMGLRGNDATRETIICPAA